MSPFESAIDRRGTDSLKWSRYAGTDILPMWVADMDFAAPPVVLDAIRQRLDHGVLGYAVPPPHATDAVVRYLERVHQVRSQPSEVVWLPGLVPAKSMACRCVGAPGDAVLTLTPVYPPFLHVHKDAGKRLDTVPLAHDPATNSGWSIDFERLEAAVTPETRVFLFCNPHNPVGRVYSRQDVERVADFCLRHRLLLVSDEIHCDLILEPEKTPHHSALRLEGPIRERLIVLMAASKTYNLPGMALAWAVIPDPVLRRDFRAAGGRLIPELNPLSYAATTAALEHAEPWRRELIDCLRGHRDHLRQAVASTLPGIRMADPLEATYLAWLDCRDIDPAPQQFFERAGVGLSPGADFGAPGYLRLNFGCPRQTLDEALARMRHALAVVAV